MMPKKSKADILKELLEAELNKNGVRYGGCVFSMGEVNYLGDYVFNDMVVDVVGDSKDKRINSITKFKSKYGCRYKVIILADDKMKNVLDCTVADEVYTISSMGLLIKKI